MENKMIQELVSPTKNHIFELNNKIKVLDNKIDDLEKDIVNRDTLLKQNIENFKNKLPIIIANGGHDYVEIAGIKWATMNVGANKVTDYGLYFQWGDIQGYTQQDIKDGKKQYASDWSDYRFTTDGGRTFSKYNGTDGNTILDLEDDAVHAAWGGSWRMPIEGDIQAVYKAIQTSAVTANWTAGYNGTSVAGYEIHDKNSNDTLFLPACGDARDDIVYDVGSYGSYWSSSLCTDNVSYAYGLGFDSDVADVYGDGRFVGRCVRGVLAEN